MTNNTTNPLKEKENFIKNLITKLDYMNNSKDLTLTTTAGQFRKLSSPARSGGQKTGVKQKVKIYTPSSLKRLKQTIMSAPHTINNNKLKMITLTYQTNPDSHADAKRDIDAFFKRLRRKTPESFFIWKMEYQKRGTVHFHILCYDFPFTQDMHLYVAKAWNEITGQGKDHLDAGTRLETIKQPLYICKYEAKTESNTYQGTDAPGRFWGIINRKAYDAAVDKKEIPISSDEYKKIKRFMRKQLDSFLKSKGQKKHKSISEMCNTSFYPVERMIELERKEQREIKATQENKNKTKERMRKCQKPERPNKPKQKPMPPTYHMTTLQKPQKPERPNNRLILPSRTEIPLSKPIAPLSISQ